MRQNLIFSHSTKITKVKNKNLSKHYKKKFKVHLGGQNTTCSHGYEKILKYL